MSLYDAVVHTFATVATGGFSPKTASVGFYDSLAIEAVIIFFMMASGISFSLYYFFYAQRRFDVVLDRELVAYLGILVGATLFVWGVLVFEGTYGASWGQAFRDSAFSVSSIITTTGFITADFDRWDTAARITLVLLMFIGGLRRVDRRGHKGGPDARRLPHDPPGCLQDGPPQGDHPANR
jgi:trk system potassium uptake protein TrkH